MSIKVKQALTKCFLQIKESTFDEDTIRTLLICCREYLDRDGILRELAHFIAHPIRNRGIFHTKVNSRYAKFKLLEEQFNKMKSDTKIMSSIDSEEKLSNFFLSGISVDKVDATLFEILYLQGLYDFSESHLIQYTKWNRSEAEAILKTYYYKKHGYYHLNYNFLKKVVNESFLQMLKKANLTGEDIEKVMKDFDETDISKGYIKDMINQIDYLQTVIRGTLEYGPTISSQELNDELEYSMKVIIDKFKLDDEFKEAVQNNTRDIQLCILTLLHDSNFIFYDKDISRTFMSFYIDYPVNGSDEECQYHYTKQAMLEKGVIALYLNYKSFGRSNSVPLFVSDLKVSEYGHLFKINQTETIYNIQEIPWTTAQRIDGKLMLTFTN
jgi:hypothetical protein